MNDVLKQEIIKEYELDNIEESGMDLIITKTFKEYGDMIKYLELRKNCVTPAVRSTLPEFNSTEIIEIVEKNRDKCKNYKYDWRSYYNGFLDGFATYFNKHRNYR